MKSDSTGREEVCIYSHLHTNGQHKCSDPLPLYILCDELKDDDIIQDACKVSSGSAHFLFLQQKLLPKLASEITAKSKTDYLFEKLSIVFHI